MTPQQPLTFVNKVLIPANCERFDRWEEDSIQTESLLLRRLFLFYIHL